jgi:hypothetical protein
MRLITGFLLAVAACSLPAIASADDDIAGAVKA